MPKFKRQYTYPHRSRAAKVAYICGIGGYSRGYGERWPIEFNVSAHNCNFDFDYLWEKYGKEHLHEDHFTSEECKEIARELHEKHEDDFWNWGRDGAADSLKDSDCYTFLWDGTRTDAVLELHGRGGKHLVIDSFDGRTLCGMSDESLAEEMMAKADDGSWENWPTADLDLLYKYVRQCEVDFTPEKASAEVEYQGAFCFFFNILEGELPVIFNHFPADRSQLLLDL